MTRRSSPPSTPADPELAEWERDDRTPEASRANLAELVRESARPSEGEPAATRAPDSVTALLKPARTTTQGPLRTAAAKRTTQAGPARGRANAAEVEVPRIPPMRAATAGSSSAPEGIAAATAATRPPGSAPPAATGATRPRAAHRRRPRDRRDRRGAHRRRRRARRGHQGARRRDPRSRRGRRARREAHRRRPRQGRGRRARRAA